MWTSSRDLSHRKKVDYYEIILTSYCSTLLSTPHRITLHLLLDIRFRYDHNDEKLSSWQLYLQKKCLKGRT